MRRWKLKSPCKFVNKIRAGKNWLERGKAGQEGKGDFTTKGVGSQIKAVRIGKIDRDGRKNNFELSQLFQIRPLGLVGLNITSRR
jgi:hypothetical protein